MFTNSVNTPFLPAVLAEALIKLKFENECPDTIIKMLIYRRAIVFLWLWGCVVFSSFGQSSSSAPLSPRFAERMLGERFEEIAHETLKDFLPKDKYKLLIDVQLLDPEELKRLAPIAYSPLPGTVLNQTELSKGLLLGELESLGQKRSVLIILDPEYEVSLGEESPLKEIIKESLTGKLKLNIASGNDQINIRNIGISGRDTQNPNRAPASIKQEEKNASGLWEILAWFAGLMLVGALTFFLIQRWRRQPKPLANASTTEATLATGENKDPNAQEQTDEPQKESEEEVEESGPPQHDIKTEEAPVSPSLLILPTSPHAAEFVSKVKDIVKEYPKLTSEAIQDFVEQHSNKIYRVAYLIELLGFEEALLLFRGVSQKHWKIVGTYMAEHPVSNSNPIDLEEASMLYRYLVARIVEHKGLESDMGVFAIEGYSSSDLGRAIEGENDLFVAQFISGISNAMAQDILNSMPTKRRAAVLTFLATIEKLDPETINAIETTIQQHLSEQGVRPVTISNESRIFSSLSNLPPHEEEILFSQMAQSDPGIVLRSKRQRLYQEHIEHIRSDILADELRSYPIEAISQMLKGMPEAAREQVMGALTEKKSLVIRDMLGTLDSQPDGPEFAEARRDFLDYLHSKYAQGGGAFIDNIFKPTSGKNSAAA